MPAVEVQNLTKTFSTRSGDVRAVDDISFAVEAGERLAYIGPNGAGKSTSIKMLTGILHPTGGRAEVLGCVPWKQRRELTRRIGTLFGQRSQLWSQLTPLQSFRLLGAIYGMSEDDLRARVDELGALLQARELFDLPVRNMSLGQRMRCELAASMLHSPEVLFLDEPSIGLDLVAKQRFRELIVRINEDHGTTIFLTSHDVADIEQVARRVIVINHGRLIFDDTVSRMRRSLLRSKVVEVRFDHDFPRLEVEGVEVVKAAGTGMKLIVDTETTSIRTVLDHLLEHHEVGDISVLDPPLEQVIAEIYEEPRK